MKGLKLLLAAFLLVGCKAIPVEEEETGQNDPIREEVEKEESIVSFMAVGDNLIHAAIYMDAYARHGEYEFEDVYEPIKEFVQSKDVAYINQETILGGTELGLSHYPMFNSPQEIGVALVNTGFDFINTSTNHSMDKFEKGVLASLDFWNQYENVVTVGTNGSFEEQKENKYIVRNGVKFGVLGYTYGTNGIPLPEGKEYLVNLISKDRIQEDVERLKGTCDSIIVSMHWGNEYQTTPSEEQKDLAKFLADLGVDVIIGEHPHVIQPMDWVTAEDGTDTLVIYSLGNFLSSQDTAMGMLGGCAAFDIRKDGNTGDISIENVKWYPTMTHYKMGGDYTAGTRHYKTYLLKDYSEEMAKSHGLNPRVNYEITRENMIEITKRIMNDKFEIVY